MNENERDKLLLDTAKSVLDEKAGAVGESVSARLKEIRFRALEEAGRLNSGIMLVRRFYAGMAATMVCLVVALSIFVNIQREALLLPGDDYETIASVELIEIFQDLDFYEWLVEGHET